MNPLPKLLKIAILLFSVSLFFGCKKGIFSCAGSEAQLSVINISYIETSRREIMDPPDGSYQPDNPNFDPRYPSTWTGNMAQYIKRYINYTIKFEVVHTGKGSAVDTEVDIIIKDKLGAESILTYSLGDICTDESKRSEHNVIRRQEIKKCTGEVYWYDD